MSYLPEVFLISSFPFCIQCNALLNLIQMSAEFVTLFHIYTKLANKTNKKVALNVMKESDNKNES